MAAVGGFRGVPTDVQLKVAKLVMERGQLLHNRRMPREMVKALRQGSHRAIRKRLASREWSVHDRNEDDTTPLMLALSAADFHCFDVDEEPSNSHKRQKMNKHVKVVDVLLEEGARPPKYALPAHPRLQRPMLRHGADPDDLLTAHALNSGLGCALDSSMIRVLMDAGATTSACNTAWFYAMNPNVRPSDEKVAKNLQAMVAGGAGVGLVEGHGHSTAQLLERLEGMPLSSKVVADESAAQNSAP